jgi:uncharacterized protein YbjQ (UPF0145 family)
MELTIFLSLLLLGFVFGSLAESRHYRSIRQRERDTLNVPLLTMKVVPETNIPVRGRLVGGNVVVSVDYFKQFLANLRNIFGGRMVSYESLLDRARREALLRMKEEAMAMGALLVVNVRLETASLSKGTGRRESVGAVEVYAYGTAIMPKTARR